MWAGRVRTGFAVGVSVFPRLGRSRTSGKARPDRGRHRPSGVVLHPVPVDATLGVHLRGPMLAILPFSTRRTDAAQGLLARQLPARLAARLAAHGVVHEPWLARRGGRIAHVIVEGGIPHAFARDEAVRLGASAAIVGTFHHDDGRFSVAWERVEAESGAVSSRWSWPGESSVPESLVRVWGALVGSIAAEVGAQPPPLYAGDDDALRAVLFDADNEALFDDGAPHVLADPSDAWSHLAAAVAADPSWHEPDERLVRRIEAWTDAGRHDEAMRAARARAEARDDVPAWLAAARLAERFGATGDLEAALRRLVALEPESGRALLRLGVFYVREGRAKEAVDPLARAARVPGCRDVADTYLGVALASLGEVARAVEMWARVARDGSDPSIVALASRNLERARGT